MSRRIAVMLGTFLFLILHGCAQDEGPGEREERIAGAEPWDVVILSDSYGWGVGEIYADSVEAFTLFRERLAESYAEIRAIRGNSPLLIRTFEAYAPTVEGWQQAGRHEECRLAVLGYNEAIREAAKAHQVPVARLRLTFNGPDFQEDPYQKGLIGPDRVHTNEMGQALIAGLLHDLGYE